MLAACVLLRIGLRQRQGFAEAGYLAQAIDNLLYIYNVDVYIYIYIGMWNVECGHASGHQVSGRQSVQGVHVACGMCAFVTR